MTNINEVDSYRICYNSRQIYPIRESKMLRLVVFTDLDGTLLDHNTYEYTPALPALNRLRKTSTPLVMVSSKTRIEIEILRKELNNNDPFVPENGGAVCIPDTTELPVPDAAIKMDSYSVVLLGKTAAEIAPLFNRLAENFPIRALSKMSAAEISRITGLTTEQAETARKREFGEAFILDDPNIPETELSEAVADLGLRLTRGGRFYHLLGDNDKGKAVTILTDIYRHLWENVITAGIGDAPNDLPLLAAVNHPFLVTGPDGNHRDLDLTNLTRIPLSGPAGFNLAVTRLLDRLRV
jgi:mannosyl-3-phosphoglycerate phosphatase